MVRYRVVVLEKLENGEEHILYAAESRATRSLVSVAAPMVRGNPMRRYVLEKKNYSLVDSACV